MAEANERDQLAVNARCLCRSCAIWQSARQVRTDDFPRAAGSHDQLCGRIRRAESRFGRAPRGQQPKSSPLQFYNSIRTRRDGKMYRPRGVEFAREQFSWDGMKRELQECIDAGADLAPKPAADTAILHDAGGRALMAKP